MGRRYWVISFTSGVERRRNARKELMILWGIGRRRRGDWLLGDYLNDVWPEDGKSEIPIDG